MNARLSAFFLFFCLFILCLSVRGGAAHAENAYVPAPFAPWIESRDTSGNPGIKQKTSAALQKSRDGGIPSGAVLTPAQTAQILEKLEKSGEALTQAPGLPARSSLEEAYSNRVIDDLRQFGYDMFDGAAAAKENGEKARKGMPAGAVQDEFILSAGDRLNVIFRGQRKQKDVYEIGGNGLLVIEDLPPVPAAGRSIGQVRDVLEDYARRLHNTDVFVSLDQVRQIDVLVVGDVARPGRKTLTVFDTVLDALNESGGIRKTGSLRQIKLVRHGRSTIIDLYGLLIHGSANMDLALQNGDKLIVPPIGPTVAVAGGVKRPGIYEIEPFLKGMLHEPGAASRKVGLEEMLEMGGGLLSAGQNRFIRLGLTADGKETVEDTASPYDPVFGDGSILMVAPSVEARAGTVELVGHTRRPGIHDLEKTPTLSALLPDEKALGPDIYPLIGVIERLDRKQMTAKRIDFPPLLVVKGRFDRKLEDGDVVRLFSRAQILALDADGGDTGMPEAPELGSAEEESERIDDPVMIAFLKERSVFVRGAVRQEGAYPVAEGATLENAVAVAGGLALEASTKNIEVTSVLQGEGGQAEGRSGTRRVRIDYTKDDPASVMLAPGDTVRVNQRFQKIADNSVLIAGEVLHPGRYDLMPGDRLSDLVRRAGGLSPQAYPDGAIFSRESERKAEESRFRAAARDLERALAASMEDKDKAPDAAQIAMARDLAAELRAVQSVGRITVEADPGVLVTQPDLDILLEAGDRVFIPKRPLSVRVSGEVLSPAVLQFRKDKAPRDYIAEAGGYTYDADKGRVFVLYPDGSAQPLQVDVWNHTAVFIPPGSTIVVPRDPKPFNFIESARDITQILSNLAITGIFLDDLRDN